MRTNHFMAEFAWLARRLGWGWSPVRRRTDRIEAAAVLAAASLVLLSMPLALADGYHVYEQNMAVSAHQLATSQNVAATVATMPAVVTGPGGGKFLAADARWPSAAGIRTGLIHVPAGTTAGSVVRIWTDAAGVPVHEPLSWGSAFGRAAVAAGLVLGLLVVVLRMFVRLIRWQLDRRRSHAWDTEWDTVGPRWTRQAG
jgi:hypothetical protein